MLSLHHLQMGIHRRALALNGSVTEQGTELAALKPSGFMSPLEELDVALIVRKCLRGRAILRNRLFWWHFVLWCQGSCLAAIPQGIEIQSFSQLLHIWTWFLKWTFPLLQHTTPVMNIWSKAIKPNPMLNLVFNLKPVNRDKNMNDALSVICTDGLMCSKQN